MPAFLQDIRHALRMMLHNPSLTTIAVIALALGIGPNTAIFSIVHRLLLTPPPYPNPDAIVSVRPIPPASRGARRSVVVSTDDFQDWRDSTRTLEHMTLLEPGALTLSGLDEPVQLRGWKVSPAFFSVLGVQPVRGRAFAVEDGKPGADRHIILSNRAWENYFGRDPGLIGKPIRLDGSDYSVVGIMPRDFAFPEQEGDYWAPLSLPPPQRSADNQRVMVLFFLARLKPGVSIEQAEAEGTALLRRVNQNNPERMQVLKHSTLQLVTLQELQVGEVRPALLVLLASVGLVLLIACANVANLLLALASRRRKELAIRASLGAGRGRLVRQVLTESVLLSLLGGAFGLMLGYWGLALLARLVPPGAVRMESVHVDLTVLGFTLAVSLVTGLVFGLAPALQSARADLVVPLRGGEAVSSGGSALLRHGKTRSLLTVFEFALALWVLVGAALLAGSFLRLVAQPLGYDPEGALTVQVSLPQARYPEAAQREAFFDQLLEHLRPLPGVRSVGISNLMPMSQVNIRVSFELPDRPATEGPEGRRVAGARLTSPGFFRAMAMPLIDGRDFTPQDRAGAEPVVIVSEALARIYFPGERAVGRRLDMDGGRRIIGVVGDVKPRGLDSQPQAEIYFPYGQLPELLAAGGPLSAMTVVARTSGDPMALVPAIRSSLKLLDNSLPLFNITTLDRQVSDSAARPRLLAVLMGIFAGLALALAAVGIYGVLSYQVAQSTREIGIRIALGAGRGRVMRLVLGQGALLAVAGIMLGLGAAWGSSRFVQSLLFGITATHPATYAGAAVFMAVVGLLGAYIPARRATSIDPVTAIRCE